MLQNAVEKRSASTAAAATAAVAHRFGIIPYDTNNTSFSLFFYLLSLLIVTRTQKYLFQIFSISACVCLTNL